MAEPVGLAIGTLTLIDQAVECFQFVRVARACDDDYETCQLRLEHLGNRLSRWGAAAGIGSANSDDELFLPQADREGVKRTLTHVVKLFEKTREIAKRARENANGVHDEDAYDTNSQILALAERMGKITDSRVNKKRKNSWVEKTKWAIYKKTEYNELIKDLESLIDYLNANFSSDKIVQAEKQLCAEEASVLAQTDQRTLEVLLEVIGDKDEKLKEELKKASAAVTHSNTANISAELNHGLMVGQSYGTMTNTFGGKPN